jgi:two-component system response regulator FlrC
LKEYVQQGRFREDLYFRLSVFPIRIPPLRERIGDILPLAAELLLKHSPHGVANHRFDAGAMQKLQAYHWPGNVRELENVIQRALILQSGHYITGDDLFFEDDEFAALEGFPDIQQAIVPIEKIPSNQACDDDVELQSLGDGVRSAEEKIILQILNEARGNRKTTAEKLGISPRTLRYKIARMKEAGVFVPC